MQCKTKRINTKRLKVFQVSQPFNLVSQPHQEVLVGVSWFTTLFCIYWFNHIDLPPRDHECQHALAYQTYQITVDQMNYARIEEDQQTKELEARNALHEEHSNGFVDEVEGDYLFNAIIEADPDGQKFFSLPLVLEVVDQYPFETHHSSCCSTSLSSSC